MLVFAPLSFHFAYTNIEIAHTPRHTAHRTQSSAANQNLVATELPMNISGGEQKT